MPAESIGIYYDFAKKEISISFFNDAQALSYQDKNPAARILAGDAQKVWIPIPSSMKGLRASGHGFVMRFKTPADARSWCRQVVLGRMCNSRNSCNEAYIKREWDEVDLEKVLGMRQDRALAPAAGNKQLQWVPHAELVQVRQGEDRRKVYGYKTR